MFVGVRGAAAARGRARASPCCCTARFRGVGTYRTAAYLPTVVPDVAYALLWLWLLNPLYGPINLALDAARAPTPAVAHRPA